MLVGLLGPLEVRADGKLVPIGGARLRSLLIRLALDASRPVSVGALASAVWPDEAPTDRAHALQSLMSRLRRALPAGAPLRSAPGGYCLDLPPESVDALRFEELARSGRRALLGGQPVLAARELRDALALWRGEALADLGSVGFAASTVARLEELRLTAIEDCAEADLARSAELTSLIAELEALVAAHPHRERPRGQLMRALQAEGRSTEALATYEQFRTWLAEELGTDPSQELQQVYLSVLRGGPAGGPSGQSGPTRSARDAVRPWAPRPALTSFVGREHELRLLRAQLRNHRLVTLLGTGGSGKTRLATTLAAEQAADHAGGAPMVELAPVTAPEDLPQAVLAALGIRDPELSESAGAPQDRVERLVEVFCVTDTLLLLDSCEHLVDAVARLVDDLLSRCPGLRVLVTSREPLGILGECLLPVPPLGVPEPGGPAEEALRAPAVRLFADRAAAVRPDFAVTVANARPVAEICRRLDGLPLAIELAAARLRLLPVEELAARLNNRFQLLSAGSRTALPRHRTLRAVVAWSWDLLEEDEQRLAEALSTFPSTISLEAAESVDPSAGDTLETVAALVDKSLLQLVDGAETRYRMLETIRAYGLERLAERGAVERAREAHARHFLDLAERAEPRLRGPDQVRWLARLTADRDNLLAAVHFTHERGDAAGAVRFGAALAFLWVLNGEYAQAVQLLRAALRLPGEAPADKRSAAAAAFLLNAVLSGHSAEARADLDRLRAAVPSPVTAHPAGPIIPPLVAMVSGHTQEGLAAIDEVVPPADPWARGMLRLIRAFLNGNHGDIHAACRDLGEAAREFRAAGERWGLVTSLTYSAVALTSLGEFEAAIAALEEAMEPARQLGGHDQQRVWLAIARSRAGDTEAARAELLDVVADASSTRYLGMARLQLGDLARWAQDLDEAAHQYGLARDAFGPQASNAAFHALYWSGMGRLALARDDAGSGRAHLRKALSVAVGAHDMLLVAEAAIGVARLLAHRGAVEAAAHALGAAHALRGAPDAHNPDVASLIGSLTVRLGEEAYAKAYASGQGLSREGAVALVESHL
ncbi:BTAD domain-containing putative transcriptional regulator [Streptomyces sp. NPDC018693]|uniref:BTAD domain-containing putative transcriptional regulator n=1 Tax=unclassified Streptomyces TaxID=2593676 RepID=UPI0037AB4A3E